MQDTKTDFKLIQLIGGPFDGQSMRLPEDQRRISLKHNGRDHIYLRLGQKPVMHHRDIAARALGGKR